MDEISQLIVIGFVLFLITLTFIGLFFMMHGKFFRPRRSVVSKSRKSRRVKTSLRCSNKAIRNVSRGRASPITE